MWFIPTRNRPEGIKALIASMQSTGCVPDAAVMIDGPLEPYNEIQWPSNWKIHQDSTHLELCGAMNALFKLYPNEKTYGFITDHGRPLTKDWAWELERTAEDWNIVLCNDVHNRIHPRTGYRRITEATCMGGELVRTLGYVLPDFLTHLYADDVLEEIGNELFLVKIRNDIVVRSLQFSKGEIPIDENHQRKHRGVLFPESDRLSYEVWRESTKKKDLLKIRKAMSRPVTFVCVNWNNYCGKGAEYVNILCNSIARNLPDYQETEFVCFTNTPEGINKDIKIMPLPDGLEGWWNKLYLFKKCLFEQGQRIIYFDLDTVITGALDNIISYNGDFAILRDFYRQNGYGSGVMMWKAGNDFYEQWEAMGFPQTDDGDQVWLEKFNADILQELYPRQFCSYKLNAEIMPPEGVKVVCFHGYPKPHECDGWVKKIWKLDANMVMEFEKEWNYPESDVITNIKHAISLPYPLLIQRPENDKTAIIVGGGPSLPWSIKDLKLSYLSKQTIFATNNTAKYLLNNHIIPDYQVIMDARPENASFVASGVKQLLASTCHASTFSAAKDSPVTIWHPLLGGILDMDDRECTFVGGGSTVGLKAICIAYIMGYRNIQLYGFDSSYINNEHHAYKQDINNNDDKIQVTFADREYITSPWMALQVEEFKGLAANLVSMGCTITVYGFGLLPDVAKSMKKND